MRLRLMGIASASALLVLVGAAVATPAGAGASPSRVGHGSAAAHVKPFAPNLTILWNQLSGALTGNGDSSQNFEASLDAFDDALADDFVVPAGAQWSVRGIRAIGVYFNGPGPADNETVTVYTNVGGLPGAPVATRTAVGADNAGTFTITLSPAINLNAGTYWVSVVSNQNFTPNGQWGWTPRSTQNGMQAKWQNPGGGFGAGCLTWTDLTTCIPTTAGPDLAFALAGLRR